MRQYDDPVEVRRGEAEDPEQFLWRGRLWKVRAVVAHWVETGAWWQAGAASPTSPAPVAGAVVGSVALAPDADSLATGTLEGMSGSYSARWFDPREGTYLPLGEIEATDGSWPIPNRPAPGDWVLLVTR